MSTSVHAPSRALSLGVPPNQSGSVSSSEPSVPYSSSGARSAFQTSQETVSATFAPFAKCSTPFTVVGTST